MLFNSSTFLIFFVLVFFVYWFFLSKKTGIQNLFLLVSSYIFYGFWDWRFLILIFISSISDFYLGNRIFKAVDKKSKKLLLGISVFVNLGLLFTFKYFNFFIDSLAQLGGLLGLSFEPFLLNLILPIGISFYTFQTLSYVIDIYRGQLKPTADLSSFLAFVSFFPQLVAGPIEKARDLLPQFQIQRKFEADKAKDGLRQILFGIFKKVVIADNCAPFVNSIFENYETLPSVVLIFGLILFSFQIYGDFSGYSDIAIGTAKLLGFKLSKNFDFPFFSRSMTELWRRWHISLSTWTGEYIFLPLSKMSKKSGRIGVVLALFCTFLILGIWHGANWTFVFFGLLHGCIVSAEYYFKKYINLKNKFVNIEFLNYFTGWFVTMSLWLLGMLLFRSANISEAYGYFISIFSNSLMPNSISFFGKYIFLVFFITILLSFDFLNKKRQFGLDIGHWKLAPMKWSVYYIFIFFILRYSGNQQDFIYFQF